MEIITFNDCRKCGSKPRVRAFGSLHLVTCPECLDETLSDPDLAVLAKRWNELNPAHPVEINLSKAFSPIKEIRLTARIDDLDLETEPETETEIESESETDMAPESEPVIPEYCAANPCKCGGDPIYFQTRDGKHTFICRECGQTVSDHMAYSGLVAKWNELNPSGWSHATAFSENPKIYVWNHGGDPDQESEPETEPERPNLNPGRGPCTCPGFDSPLQYQVGGDHYRRFSYQPVMFFRETNLDFDRANAIKYLARVGHKGDPVEDLEKAAQYLQFYEVRRMYENSLCEQFVDQIDEVPIRHAIRYLFSGEVTLAKMAIDKVLEMYRKPEDETK